MLTKRFSGEYTYPQNNGCHEYIPVLSSKSWMLTSKTGVEPTHVGFDPRMWDLKPLKNRSECESTLVNGWMFHVFVCLLKF